jgi:hypothetical protein
MNKVERQAKKHSTAINSYSFSTHSQIRNGYVAGGERKATDKVCCFVFIAFILAMLGMSIYGFASGRYAALIAGVDGNGEICGLTPNVENLPLTYYRMVQTDVDVVKFSAVCVSVCPDSKDFQFGTDECHNWEKEEGGNACEITVPYVTLNILNICAPKNLDDLEGPF